MNVRYPLMLVLGAFLPALVLGPVPACAACPTPTISSFNSAVLSSAVTTDPTYPCYLSGSTFASTLDACVGADCRTMLVACQVVNGGGPAGGGSTPYLFTRENGQFLIENDVMNTYRDISYEAAKNQYERAGGDPFSVRDEDFYKLRLKPDLSADGLMFLLKEIEPEESHIDQVRLLRIVHSKDTYVFADEQSNAIRAVREKKPAPPVDCHLNGAPCLEEITAVDDRRVEAMEGNVMAVQFDLTGMDRSNLYLVVHAWENQVLPPQPAPFKAAAYSLVPLVILDPAHPERAIQLKHLHPRQFESGMEIGLGDSLKEFAGNKIVITLRWTAHHYVDFIGLQDSSPAPFRQEELALKKAVYSDGRDARDALLRKDHVYAHTVRGDQIAMTFDTPREPLKKGETDTYFFVSSGFYHGLRTFMYPNVDATDSYKKELDDYARGLNSAARK